MQLSSTFTFLLVVGWVGGRLSLRVGRGCVTGEGEEGICMRPKLCKTLDNVQKRQHILRQFRNFIPHNPCTGSSLCCPANSDKIKQVKSKCGVKKTDVSQTWPWLAIIRYGPNEAGDTQNLCSGSLISPRHVLTSAMCVNAGPLSVVLGHADTTGGEEFNVSKVKIHPDFDLRTFSSNLAVVELGREVIVREAAVPVCLAGGAGEQGVYTEAGWGTFEAGDSTMFNRDVDLIDEKECQLLLDETNIDFVNFSLGPSLVCTKDLVKPETCVGDLGGPLVKRNFETDQFEIVGVRTIPLMCGPYGGKFPQIYTNLTRFMGWIQDMVEQ